MARYKKRFKKRFKRKGKAKRITGYNPSRGGYRL